MASGPGSDLRYAFVKRPCYCCRGAAWSRMAGPGFEFRQ